MSRIRHGIAFLGAGNMAGAIVDGLLAKGARSPSDLSCLGGSGATAAALSRRTGIVLAQSRETLLSDADTLVVAFKPQHLGTGHNLATLTAGVLVISILAGKRLETLARAFPNARNIVRCMPNTPGQIGAGVTGWASLRPLEPADQATLMEILDSLGRSVEVPEAQLDAVTGVSGSGPAYVFEFAAALRDAGIAAGLDPATARMLAVETLLGASRLLARKGADPEVLRDQVTSPNGTTAAGLRRMAERDFRGLIREAVLAAKARAEELSGS